LRTRAFLTFIIGRIIVTTLGGTLASIQWLSTNPGLPRAYWLLPVFVLSLLFQVLLWTGSDFFRRRFAVYEEGFAPPYRRAGLGRHSVPPFIPFEAVSGMWQTHSPPGDEKSCTG
jgi:hypothetical protein